MDTQSLRDTDQTTSIGQGVNESVGICIQNVVDIIQGMILDKNAKHIITILITI